MALCHDKRRSFFNIFYGEFYQSWKEKENEEKLMM